MSKGNLKIYIFLISLILLNSLNSSALLYTRHLTGPYDIQFNASIEIEDTQLVSGEYQIFVSINVTSFSDAIILNETAIGLCLRGEIVYFITSVDIQEFTPGNQSAYTNITFDYQDAWGVVALQLRVDYIYESLTYTSRLRDTGWYDFVDLYPTHYTPTGGLDFKFPNLYITLIIFGSLTFLASLVYVIYTILKRSTRKQISITPKITREEIPMLSKKEILKLQESSEHVPLLTEYCSYCGYKTDSKEKFCSNCGNLQEKT